MNALIIYKSYHNMNTEKVAMAMAEAINAKLVKVEYAQPEELDEYDLIGFGSGIYAGRPHKDIFAFVERMPPMEKKVFVFSTSGTYRDDYHNPLKEKLVGKGCEIVGEFNCYGEVRLLNFNLDLKGPLGWFLGKNKGHPDKEDLKNARNFAKGLLN
ncbi:MAG: flavodoxin [Euryarchaeota archaeon]|nr:flavodoxin [Euryarchaeota archaeon]